MAFADPRQNVEQLMIPKGARVADLGAGSGAYTIAAAEAVGGDGKVIAVEVQKDLIPGIQNAAKAEGLSNIDVVWGNLEQLGGTKIRDMSIDVAIISNVLFQIEDRKKFITELHRILKPDGKILVVDWSDSYGGLGPRQEDIVPKADSVKFFESHHFTLEREIQAGDHHYGLVLRYKPR